MPYFLMVMWLTNSRAREYTLHSWLSLAELALFVVVSLLFLLSFFVVISSVPMTTRMRLQRQLSEWKQRWTQTNVGMVMKSLIRGLLSRHFSQRSDSTNQTTRAGKGFSRISGTLLTGVLVANWAFTGGMAMRDHEKIRSLESQLAKYQADTVTEHHVDILGELGDGDFALRSDEEPKGGVFRPCLADMANGVNVPALLRSAIGYQAIEARWEERGTCKSILRADLGFTFRDESTGFEHRTASR